MSAVPQPSLRVRAGAGRRAGGRGGRGGGGRGDGWALRAGELRPWVFCGFSDLEVHFSESSVRNPTQPPCRARGDRARRVPRGIDEGPASSPGNRQLCRHRKRHRPRGKRSSFTRVCVVWE